MNVTAESYGHTVLLNVKGELTDDTIAAFKQAVDHNLPGKGAIDVVLNMEAVTFVDSVFLEYLLDLQDRLGERLGQVKLIKPDDNVRKILEITRMSGNFEVFKDVGEAVKAIQT
jgi:anti-anti-sigma factor